MAELFFHGWMPMLRAALSAAVVYAGVVVALRLAGERALAQMSGYDLIVTVAIGSLAATIPVTTDVSVSEGGAAIVTLLVLQEVTRRLQARSDLVHHFVRERPHLVLWDGEMLEDRLFAISVTADEVRAAVRGAGHHDLREVLCVVLENDGSWSVIPRGGTPRLGALEGLDIPARLPSGRPGDAWQPGGDDGSPSRHPSAKPR
jgi:uncharacterized membrane protein YcaP (DUF421 family)